jgi:hypothetical protein
MPPPTRPCHLPWSSEGAAPNLHRALGLRPNSLPNLMASLAYCAANNSLPINDEQIDKPFEALHQNRSKENIEC